MSPRYKSRIMAVIDGCVFEVARFRRGLTNYDIRYCTRHLSAPWWIEKTLNRHETITSRWSPPGASALAHSQRAGHALKCKQSQ